ncbi:TPA: PAAR domain-containing protein, partial [Yersinia enterocolitica]
MSKGFVLLGDKTTYSGEVIPASSTMIVNNKKVALVGDKISCPKEGHGINTIIEGSSEWSFDGRSVVVDGCHCECGCQVISSAILEFMEFNLNPDFL